MADTFDDAAHRHRVDAKHLAGDQRFQNAGHLIGFAAECLVKSMLEQAGQTINKKTHLAVHFPQLTQMIQEHAQGRLAVSLTAILQNSAFLQSWHAEGRYEANMPTEDSKARFAGWQSDVASLFMAAGIP